MPTYSQKDVEKVRAIVVPTYASGSKGKRQMSSLRSMYLIYFITYICFVLFESFQYKTWAVPLTVLRLIKMFCLKIFHF